MNGKYPKKMESVRFVPLTKEPQSQRKVLELFSGSESSQLVKASTPAGVEVETSAKKFSSAWNFLGGEASGKSRGNSFSGIVD